MHTPESDWTPSLPGLAVPSWGRSHIEASAQATIRELEAKGLLEARHALSCQVILELARAVGNGLAAAKVTVATATLSKHLLEAMEALPQPPAEDKPDAVKQLEDELKQATEKAWADAAAHQAGQR